MIEAAEVLGYDEVLVEAAPIPLWASTLALLAVFFIVASMRRA